MSPQCCGRMTPTFYRVAQRANVLKPSDDLLAVLVDRVATFRDELGFAFVAQPVEPCDALLAAIVDHVALFLDERVFVQVAQPVEPCDALLAAIVDHVALFLDERVFVQVAQPVEPCDALLASSSFFLFCSSLGISRKSNSILGRTHFKRPGNSFRQRTGRDIHADYVDFEGHWESTQKNPKRREYQVVICG